jgi:hypothetical protein
VLQPCHPHWIVAVGEPVLPGCRVHNTAGKPFDLPEYSVSVSSGRGTRGVSHRCPG